MRKSECTEKQAVMSNFRCQEQAHCARCCATRVKLCAEATLTTSRNGPQLMRARRARTSELSTRSSDPSVDALNSS